MLSARIIHKSYNEAYLGNQKEDEPFDIGLLMNASLRKGEEVLRSVKGRGRPKAVTAQLQEARVARLATVDKQGRPHLIPICYVFDGGVFYTPIDNKPKRVEHEELVRVRNIRANPLVALLIDKYDENWNRLWYILVRGTASVLDDSGEKQKAMRFLKEKYPNYRMGLLSKNALVIGIRPQQITWWGNL